MKLRARSLKRVYFIKHTDREARIKQVRVGQRKNDEGRNQRWALFMYFSIDRVKLHIFGYFGSRIGVYHVINTPTRARHRWKWRGR